MPICNSPRFAASYGTRHPMHGRPDTMTTAMTNPKVDQFLRKAKRWQDEMSRLRMIVLDSGLTEELKWYQPCYTYGNGNVAIISGFKDYCVLSFFKGSLLNDPQGLLQKPGENSQAARVIRFTGVHEIDAAGGAIRALVKDAIRIEKAGRKVEFKKITEFEIPLELKEAFTKSPSLQKAFRSLTPGRQRAYILHFSSAKQSSTRRARIEKHRKRILDGKGLDD